MGQIGSIVVVISAGLLGLNACGGGSSSGPSATLNLTGTWSGIYGPPGSGTALRLTWEATQSGNTVSGIATLVKPAAGVQARGALTASLTGDRLVLSYFVPSDSIAGFSRCSIAGVGSATATNTSIAGQLSLTFDACAGTGLEAPGTNNLALNK